MTITFLLAVLLFSIIIEIITVLFRFTGLEKEKAHFQVISLLTGTGFTTREAELITQHPMRRKLAQIIMLLGYIGLVTFVSFIINIIKSKLIIKNIITFGIFFIILIYIFKNKSILIWIDNKIQNAILKYIRKGNSVNNFYKLLNKSKGYGIYNILIEKNSKLIGKTLENSNLKNNLIQVLNVDKGNTFIAFPTPNYIIEQGDNLLVYGKTKNIVTIFKLNEKN